MSYERIKPDIIEALREWGSGTQTHPCGDFLHAVLTNNLRDAFRRADNDNFAAMGDIVTFVYNELPAECWGSPEKVAAWLERAQQNAQVPA